MAELVPIQEARWNGLGPQPVPPVPDWKPPLTIDSTGPGPAVQTPPLQMSPVVQAFPSSHGLALFE
jgi:hypothetical protein